ncbi:MAG: response regulator [Pseudomonadota bacterium]
MACHHILLVDDEPLVAEELQESLELEGFRVDTAHNVAAALEHPCLPSADLVVTDLKMPGGDGLELVRTIASGPAPTPKVIVLSGHGAEDNRAEALGLGAVACFSKPVDVDHLIADIRKALA